MVTALVVGRLLRPDARELFATKTQNEAGALREEATSSRTRLDGLSEAFAEGEVDLNSSVRGRIA